MLTSWCVVVSFLLKGGSDLRSDRVRGEWITHEVVACSALFRAQAGT